MKNVITPNLLHSTPFKVEGVRIVVISFRNIAKNDRSVAQQICRQVCGTKRGAKRSRGKKIRAPDKVVGAQCVKRWSNGKMLIEYLYTFYQSRWEGGEKECHSQPKLFSEGPVRKIQNKTGKRNCKKNVCTKFA